MTNQVQDNIQTFLVTVVEQQAANTNPKYKLSITHTLQIIMQLNITQPLSVQQSWFKIKL